MITTNKIPIGQVESEVSQTITLGVINTAPSEDAVFDALALRSLNILKTTTTVSHTGDTNNTSIYSGLIPANTFTIGDYLSLIAKCRKQFTNGNATFRIYINTSNTLIGATLLATRTTTNTTISNVGLSRNLIIKSVSLTETVTASSNLATDLEAGGIAFLNIDWSVDQYLIFSVQLTSGADTGDISSLILQKL